MTVLGIDTATPRTSVGVARNGRVIVERTESRERDHASHLADLVTQALEVTGAGPEGLDGVAVSVGPGSFTGIRVGIGFAKGLAFARGVPLVGIGTTDALAAVAPEGSDRVAVCLDARKGEVYLALHQADPEVPRRLRGPEALRPEEAVAILEEELGEGIVIGDGPEAHRDVFAKGRFHCLPFREWGPQGGRLAVLGLRQLEQGAPGDLQSVRAVYVRPGATHVRPAGFVR